MPRSAFSDEYDDITPRFSMFYEGLVVRNDDPEQRGRIKATIPGLQRETAWAIPTGFPGAGVHRGLYAVPDVETNVIVGFIQGDEQMPFYLCSGWGAREGPEVPREVLEESPAEAHMVKAFESEQYEVFINDKQKKLVLRDKRGAEEIEIDSTDRSIRLKATNWVIIQSGGIRLDCRQMQINNRKVLTVGNNI